MIEFLYKTSDRKFGKGKGLNYPKSDSGITWIHLSQPSESELNKVKKEFGIPDKILNKFYSERSSIRYSFDPLIFTLVDYYVENNRILLEDVLFVVKKNVMITITKKKLNHYDEIFDMIYGKLKKIKMNIGYILYEIIDFDSEENFDVLRITENKISEIEKMVIHPAKISEKLNLVIDYKRYLLQMWRRFWANSKILFFIRKGVTPIDIDDNLQRLFIDVHDTFVYQMDIVTTQREVLTDALTIYESVLANKLARVSNKINTGIKKLTIIMFFWTAIATILSIPNTVATMFGIPEWPLTVNMWHFIAFILIVSAVIPIIWFFLYWRKLKLEQ